ncbi:MAG: 1-acyl-sn-glycerol-3-phosphate acyltransferase [Myxococcales bacterium]|nr:1-acyl-sn-glycerol-3-phosphate acyltransferase [Myxococcales bacterium]
MASHPDPCQPTGVVGNVDPASSSRRWVHRLPRWVRVLAMAALFLSFFAACPFIALAIPLMRLFFRDHKRRVTRLLNRGLGIIIWWARFMGTVDFDDPELPEGVDPDGPFVMICNHPTYVDMLLLLGSFPQMSCVTSGRWSKHWALGPVLRATDYLPGPGSGRPESEDMLGQMVEHLKAGRSLLIFPEGQRSLADKLRRFRRGAIEAAAQAGVPVLPMFLGIDRPYLTKGVPLHRPPPQAPRYTFEWFETVRPDAFDGDGKRIHQHLVGQYEARFTKMRALQASLQAS